MSATTQFSASPTALAPQAKKKGTPGRARPSGSSLPELLVRLVGYGLIWLGLLALGAAGVAGALARLL